MVTLQITLSSPILHTKAIHLFASFFLIVLFIFYMYNASIRVILSYRY